MGCGTSLTCEQQRPCDGAGDANGDAGSSDGGSSEAPACRDDAFDEDELHDDDEDELLTMCVACCKNDIGRIDQEELQAALNAVGLYPTTVDLQKGLQATSSEVPLCFGDFPRLVDCLQTSPCERGPRAVPHARRGLRLCQLQDVHRVFVESGWLSERCSAFNEANAQGIAQGTPTARREDLYALDEFLVRPSGGCEGGAWDLRGAVAPSRSPVFAGALLLVRRARQPAGRQRRLVRVALLGPRLQADGGGLGTWGGGQVVFWICLFALNQHRLRDELGSGIEAGPFNIALQKAGGGAVMVLDEAAAPFKRIWCMYEVFRMHQLGQPFQQISDWGVQARPQPAVARSITAKLAAQLREMSVFDAEAALRDKLRDCRRELDEAAAGARTAELPRDAVERRGRGEGGPPRAAPELLAC